jgi:hypothetical protein
VDAATFLLNSIACQANTRQLQYFYFGLRFKDAYLLQMRLTLRGREWRALQTKSFTGACTP